MIEQPSPWHGRRVLVTGCTGFLGTAVTRELLDHGAIVVGLIRNRITAASFAPEINAKRFHLVHGRVEDVGRIHSSMALHEVSAAFHLARGGAVGDDAILRAAALYHPRLPLVTARPAHELRLAHGAETPVPVGIARFGEVFGENPRVSGLVATLAMSMLRGEKHSRTESQVRDYVYIRDAARACLALAAAVATGGCSLDVTFRSGWAFTEKQLGAVLANPAAESHLEVPENLLGWRPETPLPTAVRNTVEWYRDYLEQPCPVVRPLRRAA